MKNDISSYKSTYTLNKNRKSTAVSAAAAATKSLQSCPTLCDPMGYRLPGSSIHGIFQAKVLEWVAIAFSTMLPYPSPTLGTYSNSCPLSQWCHPTISSSVIPFSSSLQSFPVSGSFPRSQFFISGGQSIGVLALASGLPVNIQDWFPLGWTGCISLLSKGLSRVFFNTTVQKQQFFGTQLSL